MASLCLRYSRFLKYFKTRALLGLHLPSFTPFFNALDVLFLGIFKNKSALGYTLARLHNFLQNINDKL